MTVSPASRAASAPARGGPAVLASGVVAATVGWAVAQLIAAVVNPAAAPLDALAAAFIDITPAWLKEFAITVFGAADKIALGAGIAVCFLVIGALLGVAYQIHRGLTTVAIAAFGLLGAVVAMRRPGGTGLDWLPTAVGAVAAWATLRLLANRIAGQAYSAGGQADSIDRRRLLGLMGGLGGAAVLVGVGARSLGGGSAATAGPDSVRLPAPAVPAPPIPSGASLPIPGLSPYVTPPGDFYRVDTAFVPPRVDPDKWRLRVHGLVEQEVELTFAELLALPLVESYVTLTCVSNPVGGPYAGNARWLGWPVRELLARAGPLPGADMVLSTSADGWSASTPLEVLTDPGRAALLAVGMNGAPLPAEHGFPVRMVVPGLYGYVSATKWVVDLEVTRFADRTAYWTDRGWAPRAPIKLASRIDVPGSGSTLAAGRVVVAGVAWAQHTGIAAVEVSVDDGPWGPAQLAATVGPDTWRQWRFDWAAAPGDHQLAVRAVDARGQVQTGAIQGVLPDGATGHHTIRVTVTG